MSAASPVSVHLLPDLIPDGALAGSQAVVIDVLRATTVIVHALEAGCEAVIPCLEVEVARAVAATLPNGTALLGGERQALPIPGFDLGNAPEGYTPEACRGKTLVLTTTNGTRAILAALDAARVLVAGFVNMFATCQSLQADGRPVHLIASGTDRQVSFEDTLLAGALVARLSLMGFDSGNDEALVAARLWADVDSTLADEERKDRPLQPDVDPGPPEALVRAIGAWRGGRRLRTLGRWRDVRDAARLDRFARAVELRRDPLRLVAVADGEST